MEQIFQQVQRNAGAGVRARGRGRGRRQAPRNNNESRVLDLNYFHNQMSNNDDAADDEADAARDGGPGFEQLMMEYMNAFGGQSQNLRNRTEQR